MKFASSFLSWVVLRGRVFATSTRRAIAWAAALTITAAIAYVRIDDHLYELSDAKVTARNFYGTLRVFNGGEGVDARRTLSCEEQCRRLSAQPTAVRSNA